MKPSHPYALGLALAAISVALACEGAPPPPPPPATPPYAAVADVKQLMEGIMEPAADRYWDAVGSVDDAKGTHSHAPRDSAGWADVRHAALLVAESGNLLMMAPRARDQDDWMKKSLALIETAKHAMKAAEARDTLAVFNAGAEVYDACVNCHAKYMIGQPLPTSK